MANIEHGELVCECGHRGTPRLEESGYQVSHELVEIVGDTIIASGWDGSSRAVSEDGDALLVDVRWVREAASTSAGPAYRLEVRYSVLPCD